MRSGTLVTQIQGYKAFIPKPLPPAPPLELTEAITKKLATAELLIKELDQLAFALPNAELFITMYIKKEALLSAQIEGSQASLEDVLEFEEGNYSDNVNDIREVINYIKALYYGIERLEQFPMSLRFIKELHTILLEQTRGKDKTPGEFKRSQNWIGGSHSSLKDAIFIPPPPQETIQAMSDLEKYIHEGAYHPLIDCALIHYQFETIHPFLDGNGRAGRLLIVLFLYWKNVLKKPLLYTSYFFKKNRREYFDRLMLVRTSGNYEQWVEFVLNAYIETAESAIDETKKILALQNKHQKLVVTRSPSKYHITLLDKLFYTPVVRIQDVQNILNVSFPTASKVTHTFVDLGILKEVTGQRRLKRFVYKDYLDILEQGTLLKPG